MQQKEKRDYMPNIRIVTDSTADLPQEIIDQYGITVIPLTVIVNGQGYRDRIDISNDEFYQQLAQSEQLPTTSQPAPAYFASVYQELASEGAEHIISIHLSEDLSGTVQGAQLAKNIVANEVSVSVINSQSATMGLGLVVLSVAKAVAEGKSIGQVLTLTEQIVNKLDLFFLLDTLDNLQKGGRIGKASFLVGSILNIKPILRLNGGIINAYEKVRGNKECKALDRMIDVLTDQIDPTKKVYCSVGYCNNIETAQYLVNKIKDRINCDEYTYMQIGNVVATHIGLGAVGIAFYQL